MTARITGRTVALALALGGLVACASTQRGGSPDRAVPLPTGPAEALISARTGTLVSFADVIRDARDARIVYVGETHTNPVHHAMQLDVVREMWRQDPRLSIGMEMFFRPYQPALDDYVAGRISERELLRRTEYFTRWSFPWEFYAPILRFAREKRIPVVALNIPKEITRTVARQGLDALTEEQRAEIPELHLESEEHRAFVREVFLGGHRMPEAMFENFYTAMCVWDDGMAESAVRFLESPEGEGRRMVVLVGAGHVRRRFGIPDRVEMRTGWEQRVFVPIETDGGALPEDWSELAAGDEGDVLYVTPPPPMRMPRRMGVVLETENPPAEGLLVKSVGEGSPAARAGVEAGDVLLRLDDRPVADLFALRWFLENAELGHSYRLELLRGDERITTALVLPTRPPHPMRMPRP